MTNSQICPVQGLGELLTYFPMFVLESKNDKIPGFPCPVGRWLTYFPTFVVVFKRTNSKSLICQGIWDNKGIANVQKPFEPQFRGASFVLNLLFTGSARRHEQSYCCTSWRTREVSYYKCIKIPKFWFLYKVRLLSLNYRVQHFAITGWIRLIQILSSATFSFEFSGFLN